jgi:glutamine synthetase
LFDAITFHRCFLALPRRVRAAADRLEKVIPDDYWPLPTYRDMLFVK